MCILYFKVKESLLGNTCMPFPKINETLDEWNIIPYNANTDKVVISNGRETIGLNTDRWLTSRVL